MRESDRLRRRFRIDALYATLFTNPLSPIYVSAPLLEAEVRREVLANWPGDAETDSERIVRRVRSLCVKLVMQPQSRCLPNSFRKKLLAEADKFAESAMRERAALKVGTCA
jgi:hypothetical protein